MITKGHSRSVIRTLVHASASTHRIPPCPADTLIVLVKKGYVRSHGGPRDDSWYLTPDGHNTRRMLLDIQDRYQRGQSGMTLARRYGVCDRTVLRWLRHMDVPIRRNGTKLSDEQRAEIARRYTQEETSLAQLALSYGVTTFPIRTALLRQGVSLRPFRPNRPRYDTYTGRRIPSSV